MSLGSSFLNSHVSNKKHTCFLYTILHRKIKIGGLSTIKNGTWANRSTLKSSDDSVFGFICIGHFCIVSYVAITCKKSE